MERRHYEENLGIERRESISGVRSSFVERSAGDHDLSVRRPLPDTRKLWRICRLTNSFPDSADSMINVEIPRRFRLV
jgi:hypothetical protein